MELFFDIQKIFVLSFSLSVLELTSYTVKTNVCFVHPPSFSARQLVPESVVTTDDICKYFIAQSV